MMFVDTLVRSIENPQVPLSDPDAWDDAGLLGGKSSSGVTINRLTALGNAAFWRGVRLLATDCAKLPCFVYHNLPTGGKERATSHPAYRLLRRQANETTTAFTLKQTLFGHAIIEGNGYAHIWRTSTGDPTDLMLLDPAETYPVKENGVLRYATRLGNLWFKLEPENVLHLKGLGYDGLVGYSVLSVAKDTLGRGIAAGEHASRFFKNNAEPRVVIEVPGVMPLEAQKSFLEQWHKMHQGFENSHKTAILTKGATLKAFSTDARQAQLLQTREFEVREIANLLGLPPHKLGDPSRTAYASLEQEQAAYLSESLEGWLVPFEEEAKAKLLTTRERESETYTIEIERAALLRPDAKTEVEVLAEEVNNGLLTLNEARSIRNRPAFDDPAANQPRIPLNMGGLGSVEDDSDGDRQIDLAPIARDVAGRMLTRLRNETQRAAKRPEKFLAWLDTLAAGNTRESLLAMLSPLGEVLFCDRPDRAGEIIDSLIDGMRADLLRLAGESKPAELAAAVERYLATHTSVGAAALARIILEDTPK